MNWKLEVRSWKLEVGSVGKWSDSIFDYYHFLLVLTSTPEFLSIKIISIDSPNFIFTISPIADHIFAHPHSYFCTPSPMSMNHLVRINYYLKCIFCNVSCFLMK